MSASGNDFVMIDNRDGKVYDRFPDILGFCGQDMQVPPLGRRGRRYPDREFHES